jgi:hypothetical protein
MNLPDPYLASGDKLPGPNWRPDSVDMVAALRLSRARTMLEISLRNVWNSGFSFTN